MVDVVSPEVRSRMMAGIKGKNTKPELLLRKQLHARGFRFRLHAKDLPGRPDIILPRHNAVIFVHGCFWHGHDCHLFKWPSSRPEFWRAKIDRNRAVDERALAQLKAEWRYAVVWECALKGKQRLPLEIIAERCAKWLTSNRRQLIIRGADHGGPRRPL